jgi:hypothetical protein
LNLDFLCDGGIWGNSAEEAVAPGAWFHAGEPNFMRNSLGLKDF